jgi:hypothetical protein
MGFRGIPVPMLAKLKLSAYMISALLTDVITRLRTWGGKKARRPPMLAANSLRKAFKGRDAKKPTKALISQGL